MLNIPADDLWPSPPPELCTVSTFLGGNKIILYTWVRAGLGFSFLMFHIFQPAVRSCPPLSRPKNGFLRCSNSGASNRTECQVGCDRGYRLEGPSRLACQANSLWSGPQPRCVGKPSTLSDPCLTSWITSERSPSLLVKSSLIPDLGNSMEKHVGLLRECTVTLAPWLSLWYIC